MGKIHTHILMWNTLSFERLVPGSSSCLQVLHYRRLTISRLFGFLCGVNTASCDLFNKLWLSKHCMFDNSWIHFTDFSCGSNMPWKPVTQMLKNSTVVAHKIFSPNLSSENAICSLLCPLFIMMETGVDVNILNCVFCFNGSLTLINLAVRMLDVACSWISHYFKLD